MGHKYNPDAELERLNSIHERISRLREDFRILKQQEDSSRDFESEDLLKESGSSPGRSRLSNNYN